MMQIDKIPRKDRCRILSSISIIAPAHPPPPPTTTATSHPPSCFLLLPPRRSPSSYPPPIEPASQPPTTPEYHQNRAHEHHQAYTNVAGHKDQASHQPRDAISQP